MQDTAARAAEVETQALKLARELAEYKAESKGLVNQELTIRRLEDRNRVLEADLAAKVGAQLTFPGKTGSPLMRQSARRCIAS